MSLYEPPQPAPEAPADPQPETPAYDDAATMAECQALMNTIGGDFGIPITYAEGRANLADLAPTVQMRAVVRLLFATGLTQEQWAQACHLELRDLLRSLLTDLEAKGDQRPKRQSIAVPPPMPLVLPNGRPARH